MHGALLAVLIGIVGLGVVPLSAQEPEVPLPMTGSLIYNALFLNRVNGTGSRGLGLRFAGRVATPIGARTYLGLGGGSWIRVTKGDCGLPNCDGYVGSQSEAVIYQLYLQRYVTRNQLFVRAGVGLADTRTLFPENRILIAVIRRWRGAVSAGVGTDFRIARYVYLTPSLDFTVLPGADTGAHELGSGLAVGVALTLR
jgi:hypothetical protein